MGSDSGPVQRFFFEVKLSIGGVPHSLLGLRTDPGFVNTHQIRLIGTTFAMTMASIIIFAVWSSA